VAGLVEVAGHLEGEHAARGQRLDKAGEQAHMVRHPLQGGAAQQHVHRLFRLPLTKVTLTELEPPRHRFGLGLDDHLGGAVDPHELGMGPAVQQLLGGGTRPAAQVHHPPWIRMAHPGDQFPKRPLAFVAEAEVLLRIPPGCHGPGCYVAPAPTGRVGLLVGGQLR
jgi:hypothetical protein